MPTRISGLNLSMHELATSMTSDSIRICQRLCDEYDRWIVEREREVSGGRHLSPQLLATARRHIDNCKSCLRRMRDGVQLLDQDDRLALAFRLMNEAMLMQHVHYTISSEKSRTWVVRSNRLVLDSPFIVPNYGDHDRAWRPFQLAFILMNLDAVSNPDCSQRDLVDVIWFPTGGGKTEAYLGLSALYDVSQTTSRSESRGYHHLNAIYTQAIDDATVSTCSVSYVRMRDDSAATDRTIGRATIYHRPVGRWRSYP